jgi:hypothetical protein
MCVEVLKVTLLKKNVVKTTIYTSFFNCNKLIPLLGGRENKYDVKTRDVNTKCLRRIESLFTLHKFFHLNK